MESVKAALNKLCDGTRDFAPEITTGIGSFVTTAGTLLRVPAIDTQFFGEAGTTRGAAVNVGVTLLGAAISAGGAIYGAARKRTISRVEEDLKTAGNHRDLLADAIRNNLDVMLSGYARYLEFGTTPGVQERIALYIPDPKRTSFIQLSRWSESQNFRRKNRSVYPFDHGCIYYGWRDGVHFDTISVCKTADPKGYAKEQRDKFGLLAAAVKDLRMPSRLYYSRAVSRAADLHPIGVLVIEATEPTRYTRADLDQKLGFAVIDQIHAMIEALGPTLPVPSVAERLQL